MLQLAGYTVLTADTAIDALQRLKDGPAPDLAVLDMRLPDLPGSKLTLRIHAEHPRIPILFVSGWVGEAVNLDQLATLRWEFLLKPFTRESLLPLVERLLGAG
jgi:CheY-like chemotaxis protein